MGEEAEAWTKPTSIMRMSHWNKLFPFQHYLDSQLFHYCPALSSCQHKKYHHKVKCVWYSHKCIPSGSFTAINLPSHCSHFLQLCAYILVPGNPVPAAVAHTGAGKRWEPWGIPCKRADLPRAVIRWGWVVWGDSDTVKRHYSSRALLPFMVQKTCSWNAMSKQGSANQVLCYTGWRILLFKWFLQSTLYLRHFIHLFICPLNKYIFIQDFEQGTGSVIGNMGENKVRPWAYELQIITQLLQERNSEVLIDLLQNWIFKGNCLQQISN